MLYSRAQFSQNHPLCSVSKSRKALGLGSKISTLPKAPHLPSTLRAYSVMKSLNGIMQIMQYDCSFPTPITFLEWL